MIDVDKVLNDVIEETGVSLKRLYGNSRVDGVVKARKLFAKRMTIAGESPAEIGRLLGKDRTTIVHYLNDSMNQTLSFKAPKKIGTDAQYQPLAKGLERLELRLRDLERENKKLAARVDDLSTETIPFLGKIS